MVDAPNPETKPDVDSLSFEEAFLRLNEMAQSLEDGGLSLNDATARFAEGMDLVRRCNQLLDEAELKITTLKDALSAGRTKRRGSMIEIGWFSTGRGEGSLGLLRFVQDRINRGLLDARIGFVFSNREPGEAEGSDRFFAQVTDYGLPLVTLSSTRFRHARRRPFSEVREDYDRQVMDLLRSYRPDVCVLAGYMLIFSSVMCRWRPMLNLHPALPGGPTGTWQNVVWDLIETKATRTGAMVHLATEDLDRGPVVSYCAFPLTGQCFDAYWEGLKQADLPSLKETPGRGVPFVSSHSPSWVPQGTISAVRNSPGRVPRPCV